MKLANSVEDRNKRTSIFTVQDAESAMTWLTIIVIVGLIYAYVYEVIKGQGCFRSIYAATDHIPKIMSIATVVIILKEGVDIMLRRFREAIRDEARVEERARIEGKTEGKAEVYQEIAAWNARRLAAESRDEKFTEPPPIPPQES